MIVNATFIATRISNLQNILSVLTMLHLTSYKYPDQSCVYDGACFDYIIVGAGTAGCVIANRLVEDRNTTVLLIEAGGDPQLESDLASLLLYPKETKAAWNYTIEDTVTKQCHKPLKDDMSLGRSLGGTSSLNYLVYSVGNHHDYDNWAKIVNDTTWSWKNVHRYFKKTQKLTDPVISQSPDAKYFGKNGNIGLTATRTYMRELYLKAFKQAGNKIVDSFNGYNPLGYSDSLYSIGNGVRQSSANSYLVPITGHSNLYVLKNTLVKRIIFDACKNAVGVEAYTSDKRHIIIKSRKEVILSAGVVNTPQLLMLSGVGPRKHLCSHKIDTISDLPVGRNLQDHLAVTVILNMTKLVIPYRSWNPNKFPATGLTGYVSMNKSGYPDYQSIIYENYPSLVMAYCTFTYGYSDSICDSLAGTDVTTRMMFVTVNKQVYKSRGKVLLRSNDYRDEPIIYTNYYSVEEDLKDHARNVKHFMEILNTPQMKEIGGEFTDPHLSKCKSLEKGSIEYWMCYVKCMATSQHHYSGTCAMGSVVDSRLRVYGVKKLRVADASSMPHPTAGGTFGSTIVIGELVSDMIKEDNNI